MSRAVPLVRARARVLSLVAVLTLTALPAVAEAGWHGPPARCGRHAMELARVDCKPVGKHFGLCGERLYRMRPLVEACGFATAIELVLADDARGRYPASSAKTLWFEPGGDYLIDEPVIIDQPGIEIRGSGALMGELKPEDWRRRGTTFRCAVDAGEVCLAVTLPYDADFRTSFTMTQVTFLWEGAQRPDDVTGLLLTNVGSSRLEDLQWWEFPGSAVRAHGVAKARFDRLKFASEQLDARTAVYMEVGPAPAPGEPAIYPNSSLLQGLSVKGYDVGVWYVGGNSVTIADSTFVHSRANALRLDGAESLTVRGCRFQDSQEAPSTDSAYIRVERRAGWWYPDIIVDGSYFQCGCRPDRYPIAADVFTTSRTPTPRVLLRGNTFRDCAPGIIQRAADRTVWQCEHNRVVQRVSTGPSIYANYSLDHCGVPEEMPPHPETCE